MPPISFLAQRWKIHYFSSFFPPGANILDVGAGKCWARSLLLQRGFPHYHSVDLFPPADSVGDILQWKEIGLQPESFDVICAFELIEHVDCMDALHALLAPNGLLCITTPVPSADHILRLLECIGFCQRRTSPHNNLVNIHTLKGFSTVSYKRPLGLVQWAVFQKKV